MRMSLVVNQFKVIKFELINFANIRVDLHLGERHWISAELELGLLKMV